jgi:hypothetical protein
MNHIIPTTVEPCPVREQCWCDLKARGIKHGSLPMRQTCCRFEMTETIYNCPRIMIKLATPAIGGEAQ